MRFPTANHVLIQSSHHFNHLVSKPPPSSTTSSAITSSTAFNIKNSSIEDSSISDDDSWYVAKRNGKQKFLNQQIKHDSSPAFKKLIMHPEQLTAYLLVGNVDKKLPIKISPMQNLLPHRFPQHLLQRQQNRKTTTTTTTTMIQ